MDMPGRWADTIRQRRPFKKLIHDLHRSVGETYGQREGTAYNGHVECECYHAVTGGGHAAAADLSQRQQVVSVGAG